MTREEKRVVAEGWLNRYRKNSEVVDEWQCEVSGGKKGDQSGIRSGAISDPTARIALKLADPPKYIAEMYEWICAINDAWLDMTHEDEIKGTQKAYVMEHYFGLTEPPSPKRADEICISKSISEGTLYGWRTYILDAVVMQAMARKLV